jgi:hypothetical protein
MEYIMNNLKKLIMMLNEKTDNNKIKWEYSPFTTSYLFVSVYHCNFYSGAVKVYQYIKIR